MGLRRSGSAACVVTVCAALLPGCAGSGSSEVSIGAGEYRGAFDATRAVLSRNDYVLDRVDAAGGVITTRSKHSSGFATPWNQDPSGIGASVDDVLHRNDRAVRVTFVPTGAEWDGSGVEPKESFDQVENGGGEKPAELGAAELGEHERVYMDLRDHAGEMRMMVEVMIFNTQTPGWRVESSAIRHSTHAWDPALAARGMQPGYRVAWKADPALAARLAGEIRRLMESGGGAVAAAPPTSAAAGERAVEPQSESSASPSGDSEMGVMR